MAAVLIQRYVTSYFTLAARSTPSLAVVDQTKLSYEYGYKKKVDSSVTKFPSSYLCRCFFIAQRHKPGKVCSTQLEMMEFSKMEQELMISDPLEVKSYKSKWLNLKEWRKRLYKEESILAVDEFSLVLFPLSFGIFNAIYWISVVSEAQSTIKAS